MKKVLIITYYWPPSGGSGVQRWLKFVKYLRDFGWEPVVYTPENPEFPALDNSLFKDIPENITIIKRPIWEPYSAYKKFIGQKKDAKINAGFLSERQKPKLTEDISVWIRGNFFIPDARKFWIKPSIKYLKKYLTDNPVNAIVSTGPPHSTHLIALELKKQLNIPWIADFRDPWTNIDFYKDLKLTKWADRKHHKMELEVLKIADKVIVISSGMAKNFENIFQRDYEVITNGFDTEDNKDKENIIMDKRFSISYIGTMVKTRNPLSLWEAISQLINTNKYFAEQIEIKLIGKLDYSVKQSIKNYGLENYITEIKYLSHNQIVGLQKQSQVLLLVINNTPNAKMIITGKLFEYLISKRPILCIGPADGDAAKVIKETNSGLISDFDDVEKLKSNILKYFHLFEKGKLISETKNIEKYSRKNLTSLLAKKLDKLFSD